MSGGGNRFYAKRTHETGVMRVQTGIRSGVVNFRFPVPGATPISLSFEQAYDLADALDQALEAYEKDPVK